MLTSRQDYILRIIDEVSRLLARVIFKHRAGDDREALQTVVQACERLFALEADKLFQFTPDQHFLMLSEGESPEIARDKILVYASLNAEAGKIYTQRGNAVMGRASLLNALRFTLRAKTEFSGGPLPEFTPNVGELLAALADQPLDPDTLELLQRPKARD